MNVTMKLTKFKEFSLSHKNQLYQNWVYKFRLVDGGSAYYGEHINKKTGHVASVGTIHLGNGTFYHIRSRNHVTGSSHPCNCLILYQMESEPFLNILHY